MRPSGAITAPPAFKAISGLSRSSPCFYPVALEAIRTVVKTVNGFEISRRRCLLEPAPRRLSQYRLFAFSATARFHLHQRDSPLRLRSRKSQQHVSAILTRAMSVVNISRRRPPSRPAPLFSTRCQLISPDGRDPGTGIQFAALR
jgi:hypothetical protein